MPTPPFVPGFLVAIARYRIRCLSDQGGGDMVATRGTGKAASSEADGIEDPCAVATIARLIHDLYAANGAYATTRPTRDDDLIKWSELLGAVRDR